MCDVATATNSCLSKMAGHYYVVISFMAHVDVLFEAEFMMFNKKQFQYLLTKNVK